MGMIIELIGNCSERALQAHSLWETADIDLALTFAAGRLEEREDVLAGPELMTRLMVVMSHTVSLNLKGLVLSGISSVSSIHHDCRSKSSLLKGLWNRSGTHHPTQLSRTGLLLRLAAWARIH